MTKCVIAILSVLIFSSLAFSTTCGRIPTKCHVVGLEKVVSQASAYGCTVEESTFRVSGADCRMSNPSKYIWYSGQATCPGGQTQVVNVLVQYSSITGKCI